jgi:iron complex transport system ATP-binding protein
MRPAVYAADLTVRVDSAVLLGPTDFTVGAGDWVNVIGPNGAGKSTLLRAIAGLVDHGGRLEIDGIPLRALDLRSRSRHIGFVPQHGAIPSGITVEQYVLLGRAPHVGRFGSESAADLERVAVALGQLDLGELARRSLETLSGGERQRATIARALAQEPALLLLDEPTSALDVGHQQDVLELVDQLRHDLSLTVISTMHDLTLAAQYGDHLVLLAHGRIVAEGPPVQVLTDSQVRIHYGARVEVIHHRGSPIVVPVRASPCLPTTDRMAPVLRPPNPSADPTPHQGATDART